MQTRVRADFPGDNPYELLLQSVVDYAIYLIDRDGRVSSWNAGAERIKGYTADEILGEHFSRFYTDEDRQADLPSHALATAAAEGRFLSEGWRVRKDGSRFWALVAVDAVRDKSGELIGYAKVTRDITDRREAQLQALDSERRFRLLVEGVTDYAIFMLDLEGHVTSWNAGAERIKGYKTEEILGQHFSHFYTAEDRAADIASKALATARREGRFEAEGWRVRKDGTRFWASVVIDTIRNQQGELLGFAKITRDLTERREAQQRLEEAREQLFRSKMEAVGQMAAGIAHDFNNLLAAILGAADLGSRSLGDPDKLRRMLEGIQTSVKRGADLTDRLVSLARRRPQELKILNVTEELAAAGKLLQQSLPRGIDLSVEMPTSIWPIEVDTSEFGLSILNLGLNARDAMPNGGQLRLAAQNVVLHGDVQNLFGNYVAVSVADTGRGIPIELQPHIFEPFFTTKKFGGGTGLGLAQVYKFAHESSGAIVVDSKEGAGTTMTLYLPSRGIAVNAEHESQTSKPKGHVLIVEDEPFLAELAADFIMEIGYEPHIAHSAAEAIAMLSTVTRISLVFSDVVMPGGLSGLELARKIRTRYPELPVLLTSGYSEVVGSTPDEFPLLRKPYDSDQLSRSISSLIRPRLDRLG